MSVDPQFDSGTTCVDLLDMESEAFMYLDGVTTVTFFDGPCPLEQVKERLVKVVQESPWVAGKLVKKKAKKTVYQMSFDTVAAAPEKIVEKLVSEIEMGIFSTDKRAMPTSCEAFVKKVGKTKGHIKEDGFGLVKKGLPYARLTIVRPSSNSGSAVGATSAWALIFSVSHVIADGYTYYRLLQMLSTKEEIVSLNPERWHSFVPRLKEAVGANVYATYLGSAPLIMNYIGNMLFGGKPRAKAFYVDAAKVQKAKEKSSSSGTSGTDFVSTNDILTAYWGRMTGARLVEMSVNFRERFQELNKQHAGNYEGCMLFAPGDFQDPVSIRKGIQRKDGKFQSITEKPLPGFFEMRRCKYRIISNWSSFFSELEFDDCTQTLHIPYLAPSAMPTDVLIIFRPTRSTYGVFTITRKLKDTAFTSNDSPLGAEIIPTKNVVK
ncbi:unnamed protein product [Amoebophrya sp. A25]|nr:unnamed protein product [Amoebophrya sp. A25]|eukprot:GSA25T00026576001.1